MKLNSWWAALIIIQLVTTLSSTLNADKDVTSRNTRSTSIKSAQTNVTLTPDSGSFLEALSNIESDTRILLANGTYQVENFTLVTGVSNICISGQGDVTITCSDNVGLAFVNVSNLMIEGVRIEECGLSGSYLNLTLNHIREFVDLFFVVYSEMRFAVLLGHCENVIIDDVQVVNNVGFGLVGINLIGSTLINQISAVNNTQPSDCPVTVTLPYMDPLRYGGGAVFVYQDYTPAYQDIYGNSYHELTISDGTFMGNSECSYNYLNLIRLGKNSFVRDLGYRIGGGGGLTLLVTQINYALHILTRDSHFESNLATLGGAAHLALFSGVRNTQIELKNCTFTRNRNDQDFIYRIVDGAGLGVTVDIRRPSSEQATPPHVAQNLNTTIRVTGSRFIENYSAFGAGLFFYSSYTSAVSDLTDVLYVYIEQCIFERNSAFFGSAMSFFEYKYNAESVGTQVLIKDSNYSKNMITANDMSEDQTVLQSAGVIDIRFMNISFQGNCQILSNIGTGLRAEGSAIGIAGDVTFSDNVGIRGGALHLQSYSFLIVLPNASLFLLNNAARVSGGAIYSNYLGLDSSLSSGGVSCFLYFAYDTFYICRNCSDLKDSGSYIKLQNNTAPAGGHIFGSSFQRCPWATDLLSSLQLDPATPVLELISKRYPNVIDIDGSVRDPANFRTQSRALEILDPDNTTAYDNKTSVYNVVPGEAFNVTIGARDDYDYTYISNVVSSFVSSSTATPKIGPNNYGVLEDNVTTELPIAVTGSEGQSVIVTVYSTDLIGRALTQLNVSLGHCGNGFVYNNVTERCECDTRLTELQITCDTRNQSLMVPDNKWVGLLDDNGLLGVADCPLLFCLSGSNVISVANGQADFDAECNPELYRRGILCEQCIEGLSNVLGTPRCLRCSNVHILLFPVFMALGVMFTVIIYYLDITIAEGLLNGAIFFSNLVSLYALNLFPSPTGQNDIIFLISILTLNLGIETCLYNGMGGLDRVWWQLSFPLYLVVLMFIIVWLARTKNLKFWQKTRRLSAARAFTTLSLLCYVSVLQVCIEILGWNAIDTVDGERRVNWITDASIPYFQGGHIPMVLLASFIVLFYLLPFPLFLLSPSLIFKSKRLRKLKPFYDAYWNPFEPKFRFWLGFRLIFRWIPFVLSFLTPSPENLFVTDFLLLVLLFAQVTLKPFKNWWVNTIDCFFIFLLVLMFTGTLYFEALVEGDNEQLVESRLVIYNKVFIIFAFVIMCGLFYYHLYIRFTKVKSFSIAIWNKLRCKKSKCPDPQNNIGQASETEKNSKDTLKSAVPKVPPTHAIVVTELREPLLEDNEFATVISVPHQPDNASD